MSIELPLWAYESPEVRFLWRDTFGASEAGAVTGSYRSATDWNILQEPTTPIVANSGYELMTVRPRALPDIGTATFRYCYGDFASANPVAPVDLKAKEVRIQMRPRGSLTWKTVFWGRVDYQTDTAYPGASSPQGVRTYFVVDGFARTMKWYMNRTGYDGAKDQPTTIGNLFGNPGYNYQMSADGPVLGNKSSSTWERGCTDLPAHTWQGAFSVGDPTVTTYQWKEYEAFDHATGASRPDGEPWFRMDNTHNLALDNYAGITPLPTSDTETVYDFCTKIADRARGFGTVALAFADELDGSLSVWMSICPVIEETIVANIPDGGGATVYITGAQSASTVYTDSQGQPLDLVGDHRNIDTTFKYSDAEMQQYDYVETYGEYIEVAATFSLADTVDGLAGIYDTAKQTAWSPRWSSGDRGTFEGLTQEKRVMAYWDHVYQAFGLPRLWEGEVGDAKGAGTLHRIDFRCKDDGSIFIPIAANTPRDILAPAVQLLGYLPFYVGYDYSGTYPRKSDNATEYGMPSRRPSLVYLRLTASSDDKWFLPMGQLPSVLTDKFNFRAFLGDFSPSLTVHPDAVLCQSFSFSERGLRPFGDTSRETALAVDKKVGANYDITRLAFTLGVKLPHRVRFCDGDASIPDHLDLPGFKDWTKARRKKSLYVPHCHFWLADHDCIWDLSQTTITQEGFGARRGALGSVAGSPAKLRDDRARLQRHHMVAAAWYLNLRRRLRWGQKYCGLLSYTRVVSGSEVVETPPALNQYLSTATWGGASYPVATPITEIDYDHQAGTTVWATDYFNLNFRL